jgi:acyl-CoA hydrolase
LRKRVKDGACIQIGIGSMPNAVAHHLADKNDLGVHTEMLCDALVDLFNAG